MTPDLSLLSGFAHGVLLSLHVRDTCLHSGSWLLSGLRLGTRTFRVVLLAQAGHVRSAQRFTLRALPETFGSLVPLDHKTTYHLRSLLKVNS